MTNAAKRSSGIAMAQLVRAKAILRSAARVLGPKEAVARAASSAFAGQPRSREASAI
jgi:hypothetical protein